MRANDVHAMPNRFDRFLSLHETAKSCTPPDGQPLKNLHAAHIENDIERYPGMTF
jgi:hypothetical protein